MSNEKATEIPMISEQKPKKYKQYYAEREKPPKTASNLEAVTVRGQKIAGKQYREEGNKTSKCERLT